MQTIQFSQGSARDECELATASLHKPTRFHVSRRLTVSLRNAAFDVNPAKKAPVLGCLTGDALERLLAVRARIHAERDMRRSGLFGRRRERPVTVEHRAQGRAVKRELRHV